MRFWASAPAIAPGRFTVPQAVFAERLRARLDGVPEARAVAQSAAFVYARSGIRQRHLEADLEAIDRRTDWYRLVNEATLGVAERALRALDPEGDVLSRCDGLVVVSSSFAGFPAASRWLQHRLGLRPDALCYDLAGLGCSGPTQGLAFSHALLAQGMVHNVAVVCADAMGTHGEVRRFTAVPGMAEVVAHCLASDGAAALVVGRDPLRPAFSYGGSALVTRLWPDALDLNDFTAGPDNQPLLSVGKDIRTRLLDETRTVFTDDVVGRPIFLHPGGAALMQLLAEALPALADSVALSTGILEANGNLGSGSVLFVLARALEEGRPVAPAFHLFALGPGIVTTLLRVDDVEVHR